MTDDHSHLRGDEIFDNLSSPAHSAATSRELSREPSPVKHARDENGNDPSDRLCALDSNERLPVTDDGHVIETGTGDAIRNIEKGEVERHYHPRPDQGPGEVSGPTLKSEKSESGNSNGSSGAVGNQSKSAMRGGGGAARPGDLSVRWPTYLGQNGESSKTGRGGGGSRDIPDRDIRRKAKRMVRQHSSRRSAHTSSGSEEEEDRGNVNGNSNGNANANHGDDDAVSDSAVSLTSTNSRPPRTRKQRGSSSADQSSASEWSSGGEDDIPVKKGRGVLSELLSLYRQDRQDRQHGVMKSLISTSDEFQRRRWSEKSLFATDRDDSRRGSMNSVRSGMSTGSEGDESDWHSDTTKVSRNRRKQHAPHRSQDLNQPYIPSPKTSHPISPSTNITVLQRFYDYFGRHRGPATWFGTPAPNDQPKQAKGDYRNIVALVITTSSLIGVASPALSRLAPASGPGAETNSGTRKMSYYENVNERRAKMREEEELEDAANGQDEQNLDDLHRVMEEGRARTLQKGGRRRGKRRQREMAVTKHIASIVQRKLFIEMLAKSVVNYGAPAHSVESWLSSTADILQIEASFIYLPGTLIIAFRDTDVHSTDILFIKPRGGLELYRLSLLHQVYRKVVHDEISATQGCRVIRRIDRQTVPYPAGVLILIAALASATAARVAFSGSFVDILMSGVLGSLLAIMQFAIVGRHKLLSNIFEIGVAGVLSFFARGLGSTGYFCYQSIVSAAIVLILPGWHICLGALELGSKNIVAGGIRIVWAIVYTLFLSFGLSIGSQIWDAFGPEQPGPMDDAPETIMVEGSFSGNDTTWNHALSNGTFTFTNGSTTSTTTSVACYRNPEFTQWWYTEPNDWWLFLLVPLFAASLGVWFRADYRSRDLLVMVIVASAGYAVSFFLGNQISQSNVSSAVAAFTVGVLGNLYSRLGGGSAFPSMVVGILLQVPNAIAAAGGLNASSDSDDNGTQGINAAVVISIRMVQVGIGLAIGLFAAALAVYPFGKKGRYIFSY